MTKKIKAYAARLDSQPIDLPTGRTAHISREVRLIQSDQPGTHDRPLEAARKHLNNASEKLMLHHGEPGQPTLVTRTFDDRDQVFVMTEEESLRHHGPHSNSTKSKDNWSLGRGIASASSDLGCASVCIAILALIAFAIYTGAT